MKRQHTSFKTEERDDGWAVIEQLKEYGSLGPDPGREVAREDVVTGVSREYASMLERELTKEQFAMGYDLGRENIFTAARTVQRWIDTVTYDTNAEHIAMLTKAIY